MMYVCLYYPLIQRTKFIFIMIPSQIMTRWTKPVLVGKKLDPVKQFKEGRGIYRFSTSRNIAYPKKTGKILYIGKAGNLGERISKHLRNSDRESLKAYIKSENGKIFISVKRPNPRSRTYLKSMELDALNKHFKEFGMIPICNNRNEKKRR